jgi:hypothetical protein
MDWKHADELLTAGRDVHTELKNIVVWMKSSAGMGSLYRSQHEFIYVFKLGTGQLINNIELGKNGRNRTNVGSMTAPVLRRARATMYWSYILR